MTSGNMNNLEIADLLRSIAAAYKLKSGNNRFKVIAYERAADAVEHLSSESKDLWDDGKLTKVAGIGESIAKHLGEVFVKGESEHFAKLMKDLPPAMFELMKVPGIGPKRAYNVSTRYKSKFDKGDPIKVLEKLVDDGEIAKMEGMGPDSAIAIKKSLVDFKISKSKIKRMLLPYAMELSKEIEDWIMKSPDVKKVDALGSVRRKAATVGDLDFALATNNPSKAIEHFCDYPKKTRVLEQGERTASIIIPGARQVDVMVETPAAYGALLQHFTGSKHHNIILREFALKKGYSLSDYGIRKVKKKGNEKSRLVKVKTEEELYKKLGLDYIEPEMREGMGEIAAAGEGELPNLVEPKDIKGDLQMHSSFDIETSHDVGASTMEELVARANKLGYEYIAFTEHNPSKSKHNENQIVEILRRKKEKVDKLNHKLRIGKKSLKKVFNSLEIDIMPDGKLPVSDVGLALLDFALVSIHSSFKQSQRETTKRVLSALDHPKVKIFAHPTGRKINHREGVAINWPEVFDYCIKNNKWIEINAEPMRLDLPDHLVREAVKLGVKLTLGTDAHHADMLANMKWGVNVARRGWAEKSDIVNTRSVEEFKKMLEYK